MSATLEHMLGPLVKFLDPSKYVELKANRFGLVHLETLDGDWKTVQVPSLTRDQWMHIGRSLSKVTGQKFSERLPTIRGILPGGHRLFLIIGPNVVDQATGNEGLTVAIRIRSNRSFTLGEHFGLDAEGADLIRRAVSDRMTIAIAGGTGSGKTTVARILVGMIEDPSPVSVEDTPELDLKQPIATQLILTPDAAATELSHRHILDGVIRMRPDRVIIGELTIDNCKLLMRTLNMGADGGMFTVHADSGVDVIPAITELFALSDYNTSATAEYLARKIGMVIYVKRDRGRRLVSEIFAPGNGKDRKDETLWKRS